MNPMKVTQKIINSAQQSLSKKAGEAPVREFSETAEKFVSDISRTHTDGILLFLTKETKPVRLRAEDAKLYRYNNLLLYRSNGNKAYALEQNLKDFEHTGLTPKFVKCFSLEKDDFLTVMDVDTPSLIPYTKVADRVRPEVKQNFQNSVRKLLNGRILNREVFANKDALFVTKDGKKIVFADWAEASYLPPEQLKILNEKIKNWHI